MKTMVHTRICLMLRMMEAVETFLKVFCDFMLLFRLSEFSNVIVAFNKVAISRDWYSAQKFVGTHPRAPDSSKLQYPHPEASTACINPS